MEKLISHCFDSATKKQFYSMLNIVCSVLRHDHFKNANIFQNVYRLLNETGTEYYKRIVI